MPEEQFVGALERQVEQLLARVVVALRESERSRGARELADEAERLLVETARGRAGARPRPGGDDGRARSGGRRGAERSLRGSPRKR